MQGVGDQMAHLLAGIKRHLVLFARGLKNKWQNGIFANARCEVERLTHEAHAALDALPDNVGRTLLHEFATMLLERTH